MPAPCKTTVAIFKFSSCDGCQLQLLNMEDDLMALVGEVELAYFLEARRRALPGPYDVALVEGSVTTPEEAERIKQIRGQSKLLVALGTCATSGGIQALRNFADAAEYARVVYQHPEFLHYLPKVTPIAEHVPVDLELWGCPINRVEVLEVITALLQNRKPILPQHSVCLDCKRRGTVCVMVAKGSQCLGPVTQAGCNALCPSCGRGCYGCFGPMQNIDLQTLIPTLRTMERQPGDTFRLLRHVAGYAPAFHQAAEGILAEEKKA
jgi:sulfhydrogenase subunit delta